MCFLLGLCYFFSQKNEPSQLVDYDEVKSVIDSLETHHYAETIQDSLILFKQVDSHNYNVIFIDNRLESANRDLMLSFALDSYDIQTFDDNLNYHRKWCGPLSYHDIPENIVGNWLPVYMYEGEWFIYKPCEMGATGKFQITDSCIVEWYMDGPDQRFIKAKQILGDTVLITSSLCLEAQSIASDSDLRIYPIDGNVFEFKVLNDDQHFLRHYLNTKQSNDFNLIVNYSEFNKVPEFDFGKTVD